MTDTAARIVPMVCPSNHWGFAVDASGTLEVRCRSKHCRTVAGQPVIHRFDLDNGSFTTRQSEQSPPEDQAKEHDHGRYADLQHS